MMKLNMIWLSILICLQYSFLQAQIRVGAECTDDYIPYIQNKRIGIVANQTSVINGVHIVDSLLSLKIPIYKIFTPEHGFRGRNDAGEKVSDEIDSITKLPLISLYGSHKKPTKEDLQNIDIILFDIQDVGARFYTYISTMHYVMEACAENNIEFIVLDRPNPNGFYVDGPILDTSHTSFVGMHPVPIVHGMTIGEYAKMINGEQWLHNGITCKLKVIPCEGYTHATKYKLPIHPSPNLSTMQSIYLYPTLCLFEGTVMSCGRGTDYPFQVIGHPNYANKSFSFTPRSIIGASKNPPFKDQICYGLDLRKISLENSNSIQINILIEAYKNYNGTSPYFNSFFTKLAGVTTLQSQIETGMSEQKIRESWQTGLTEFKKTRKKYLLYTDF